ncbi:hypothetical protein D3H65_02455 [Paraflavitalea soli]|uniref:Uncharacterized protein n=1 Tax=Paraflavitalea soli TaxID=2315862 RepID=A0A3B7MH37_9BACT|nr:hypothetical protein [Paraflavitalea soli]AXY72897.1 hypothetical protein D3H65_02455 [Paraflavitalea soli]
MAAPPTHRILIWLSLAIGIMITSDNFLLPKHQQMEVLDNGTTSRTRTEVDSWLTYFFLTKAGNKYKVPEYLYNAVLIGDTFQIQKTLLCRRPARLSWCEKEGRCYISDIGTINGNYWGYGVMAYLIIHSLLMTLGIIKTGIPGKRKQVYFCFGIALSTLAFYLIF